MMTPSGTSAAKPLLLAVAFLAVLPTSAAQAHDFWIEPSSFHPSVPSDLAVSLRVGQNFRGDPVPRDDRRIVKFVLSSAQGERAIAGLPGADPAGLARIDQAGLLLVAYRSHRTSITLEPEKFEKYLAEEGLERILSIRKKRGEHEKPGREVYSRCAKSLIAAGEGSTPGFDRVLGLTLELVPEKNPQTLPAGGLMPVRLLLEGTPLEGALVMAMNRANPSQRLSARSDPKGRASFRLGQKGVWMIKSVHMVPAPKDADADWESLWASLTFEVP